MCSTVLFKFHAQMEIAFLILQIIFEISPVRTCDKNYKNRTMQPSKSSTKPGEYAVEEVVDKRINASGKIEYFLKWEGYPE